MAAMIAGLTWVLGIPGAIATPGFLPPTDPSLPVAVTRAAQSVFRGIVVWGDPALDLRPAQYDEAITRLQRSADTLPDAYSRQIGDLQAELVRRCKRFKLGRCLSGFPHMDSGTFFFAGDSQTLVGARHVVEDAIGGVEQGNLCKMAQGKLRIRLILLDAKNRIVLESVNGKTRTRVQAIGNPSLIGSADSIPALQGLGPDFADLADDLANDFVVIHSTRKPSVRALRWATESTQVSGTLYALGFPAQTRGRELTQANNSDGLSQYVTVGRQVSVLGTETNATPAAIEAYLNAHSENAALIADVDLAEGMSGGPVVDKQGHVRGVAVMGIKRNVELDLTDQIPEVMWSVRKSAIDGVTELLSTYTADGC